MEGVAQQLDNLAEKEPMYEGPVKESARPNGSWGDFGETQSFWPIPTRVRTTKVAGSTMSAGRSALEMLATTLPQWSAATCDYFCRSPIFIGSTKPPNGSKAPTSTQSEKASTMFWEYME